MCFFGTKGGCGWWADNFKIHNQCEISNCLSCGKYHKLKDCNLENVFILVIELFVILFSNFGARSIIIPIPIF